MASQKFRPEIRLERNSVIPLCAQLTEQIRSEIIRNRLRSGTRLVSERRLADELEINRNTVHQAYGLLASEDILSVSKVRGGGMVVSENISRHYRAPFPSLNLILPYKFSEQLKFSNLRGLEMIAGVMDRAAEQHISINILDLPDPDSSAENMKAWLDSFVPRSIGVITFGARSRSFDPVFEEVLKEWTLPHVFVSASGRYSHISSITVNLVPGVSEMLKVLSAYGHKCLGIIAIPPVQHPQFLNCAFLRGNMIEQLASEYKIRTVTIPLADMDHVEPVEIADRILALTPRPTALWVQNDEIAEKLIAELERRGMHIPLDFSVIGYDNTGKNPDLSTFDHSRFEIGALAVDVVAELFDHGKPGDALQRTVDSSFLLRGSVAYPKIKRKEKGGE